MSSATGGLNLKRVLLTEVESDFGKEIANAVVAEGALVFTLVKECHGIQQVLDSHPQLTPILLDICKEKSEVQARKLLLSLPSVDHFVNLSGNTALNIISQAYTNSKIHDVNDIKAKPIIAKMIESENRGFIFNVSFGNQNIMSKLKANLDQRFTNSKTTQITTNLRQSLKKMFSNDSSSSSASTAQNGNSSTTTTASTRATKQTVVKEVTVATNFAALATSLNNTQNGHQNGSTSSSAATTTTTTKSTPSASNNVKNQTLQEKNNKIRKNVLNVERYCAKKWKKAEKRIQKEQETALRTLHKEVEKGKRVEKSNIMKDLTDSNAATASRANAPSADTANRILEARQNRADKEGEKHAQKKLEKETPLILENKDMQLKQYHEKLYKKTIDKQINEFNRIKNKYLL